MSRKYLLSDCSNWLTLFSCSVAASLPLYLVLLSPGTSVAQEVVYGNGPTPTHLDPTFESPSSHYTLQQEVTCPVPTFNVTGFAGNTYDWANNSGPYAASDSGLGDYGIAVGFSLPLGSYLSDFCRDFATSRTSFERSRVENQLIINQYELFRYCRAFIDNGYSFFVDPEEMTKKNPVFDEGGPLSAFSSCSSLEEMLSNTARYPRVPGPEADSSPPPAPAPFTPPAIPVYPVGPRE